MDTSPQPAQTPENPGQSAAPEVAPVQPANPVAPAVPAPTPAPGAPAPASAAQPSPAGQASAKPKVSGPDVAEDVDVIEKEWVDKAENVITATAGDPHTEEEAFEDLQVDYQKKRYGVDIKKAPEK